MKIYHNPRCRKSRETLELIESKGVEPEVILYLKDTLDNNEIKAILKKLSIPASELIRKSESIYKEKYKGKSLSEDQWIAAMVENPKLIERPIVVKGKKAVLGRPPSNVLDLL